MRIARRTSATSAIARIEMSRRGNLFEDASPPPGGERVDTLLDHRNLVIERITSSAGAPPSSYVQPQDEWVVLLRGEATLSVGDEELQLRSGDYVFLPSGTPHTVLCTSEGALWLAAHLR